MYNLYKNIEDLCNSRGITVAELSRRVGLHRNTLPRLKSEPSKKLAVDTLQKIANYFNVPVDYFLDLGDPDPKDIPPEPELSDEALIFALWKDNPKHMTKEDLNRVRSFARYIEQEKGGSD